MEGREIEREREIGISPLACMQPAKSDRKALLRLGLDELIIALNGSGFATTVRPVRDAGSERNY